MNLAQKIESIRKLCNQNGIYCLSSLNTFCALDSESGCERLSKRLGISSSSVHQWIVWFEVFGLISREDAAVGKVKRITLTPEGAALKAGLEGALGLQTQPGE